MNDFTKLANLASERLGAKVLAANDDFFAPKENLVKDSKPVFIEGKYTSRGKWMDGWETRRRRTPGYDWCIVRLGLTGKIRGIVVDTSFFTGNYPERFALEGCDLGNSVSVKNEKKQVESTATKWTEVFPETSLKGNSPNLFSVSNETKFTHLRLRIYPDGGVARLRVHGEAIPKLKRIQQSEVDLVAVENGGSTVTSSDAFYGEPVNLLMPYPAKNMGDGWETKRRRGPGHDWVILKLGIPGVIERIEVNTAHFKGNFPESCSLEACYAQNTRTDDLCRESFEWQELLPRTKLRANARHIFRELTDSSAATHVRFHIYPDGGVSRLRLFGQAEKAASDQESVRKFNRLSKTALVKTLMDCCGSKIWAQQMAHRMPFVNLGELLSAADDIWSELNREDWLEAFWHHPPIGGKAAKAKQSATQKKWSAKEQSTAQKSSPETLAALAAENKAYADKFGYVFLIFATGKTSEEILAALRERMRNDTETELRIAAEEQRKITRLRLEKLLAS
jgi:allantoicase